MCVPSPRPPPESSSLHAACAVALTPTTLPPGPHLSPKALPCIYTRAGRQYIRVLTRQSATTFNQPLSFDTSKVTTMQRMFGALARALPPSLLSRMDPTLRAYIASTVAPSHALPPPGPHLAPNIACLPFCSAVHASVFNQPLSFNTSSVTTMQGMFVVRFARPRCPPTSLPRMPHAACRRMPHAAYACRLRPSKRRPTPSRFPAHTSPHVAYLPSAWQFALAFNQPLNFDTPSVKTMSYMFLVRPSRPRPSHQCPPFNACTTVVRRLPPADPYTSPRTARMHPPSDSRQGASAFNQPLTFDTSSVTTMRQMFYVRSSPRALPPICVVKPSPARCLHRGRPPPPASQPVYLAPRRMPSF